MNDKKLKASELDLLNKETVSEEKELDLLIEPELKDNFDLKNYTYPFFSKKLGSIKVWTQTEEGFKTLKLLDLLGKEFFDRFSNEYIYTRRSVIKQYLRICEANQKQVQRTKLGAGSGRSVKSTKAGTGRTRLPRSRTSRGSQVSNIPSAVKGRLAHRIMKNQIKLKMNRKEKQRARQSIIWDLIRSARIYVVDNSLFFEKVKSVKETFGQDSFLKAYKEKRTDMPVLICRSKEKVTQKGTSFLSRSVLLDENHHSYHQIIKGARQRSWVLASSEGLIDLLTRTFLSS